VRRRCPTICPSFCDIRWDSMDPMVGRNKPVGLLPDLYSLADLFGVLGRGDISGLPAVCGLTLTRLPRVSVKPGRGAGPGEKGGAGL
jgi:hypothetical protein